MAIIPYDSPRIRRVLLTTDTLGGVWTFALELARQLDARGIEVLLAGMGAAPRPDQLAEVAPLRHVRLESLTCRLEWMPHCWDDVARSGAWLLELARDFQPDVVHLNTYAAAALPWPHPVVVTAHSCVASWWRAVKGAETPRAWVRYREAVRRGLAAADLVVAPTCAMAAAVVRDHGAACEVVPNGRDSAYTTPAAKDEFILGVGRLWDEAKNLKVLAGLAPDLPWPVHLAGRAESPDGTCIALPHTRLLGQVSPEVLASMYARAAIYALPARYEPFGYSVLEAALAGCALVLGDIPSLRENWADAACFVAPDDSRGWQATLRALIGDPARRHVLGQAARVRARRFTARAMASGYLASYARALESRRVPAPAPLSA